MTQRQNEIINASISLIAEKGIQGLTIKNLAHAINVSEPALYRHFKNKTAILIAILDSFKTLVPNISDVMIMEKKSSIEKTHFIYNGFFEKFS
ncbi:MAG: TetR/AcrR family transcriptional regulator, partial [Chlorobi bacterium]|nr:TetR/AcrR family transcriptional regulator [Chlorobiota bacterium]